MSKDKWDILLHSTSVSSLEGILKKKALIQNKENFKAWLKVTNKFYPNKINQNKSIVSQLIKNAGKFEDDKYFEMLWNYKYEEDKDYLRGYSNIIGPGVYTTYVFSECNYKGKYWKNGYEPDVIIGISTKILKDLPWIACNGAVYGWCVYEENEKGLFGKGGLKRKPDLRKLKNNINSIVEEGEDLSVSNEIILDEIPIEYFNVIFTDRDCYKQIKELFKDTNIPVVKYPVTSKEYKKILEPYSY